MNIRFMNIRLMISFYGLCLLASNAFAMSGDVNNPDSDSLSEISDTSDQESLYPSPKKRKTENEHQIASSPQPSPTPLSGFFMQELGCVTPPRITDSFPEDITNAPRPVRKRSIFEEVSVVNNNYEKAPIASLIASTSPRVLEILRAKTASNNKKAAANSK